MTLSLLVLCGTALIPLATSLCIPKDGAGVTHDPLQRKLVALGDSLSDNGTGAWAVSNHTWPADPAYVGHRFSNGPVWVELLSKMLNMELEDYAVGGATSNNSATQGFTGPHARIPTPSILDQLDTHLRSPKPSPSRNLYTIMIGANDGFAFGPPEAVAPAVADVIQGLYETGARRFLIAGYPDLSRLPLRAFSTDAEKQQLAMFSASLQTSLVALWRHLCALNVDVGFIDMHRLFEDMMVRPSAYGFDAATLRQGCLVGAFGEAERTLCDNPDRYIFWDEYHPSRITHRFMADLALNASREMCDGLELSSYHIATLQKPTSLRRLR